MREAGPSRFGFIGHGAGSTDMANLAEGGLCFIAKATVALNVGDTVILHTVADEVTKDNTTGLHHKRAGIVVGGTQTGMKALTESDAVGLLAAAIDEQVLVCYSGICWGIAQPTDVAIGDKLRPDTTTAGRLLDGTDTTEAAAGVTGKVIGTALSASAAAGDAIKVLVALG
jgi:hypothetical protein